MEYLNTVDITEHDKRFTANVYYNQKSSTRLRDGEPDEFDIKREERQACILSPKLFNLYMERIFEAYNNVRVSSSMG